MPHKCNIETCAYICLNEWMLNLLERLDMFLYPPHFFLINFFLLNPKIVIMWATIPWL